MGLVTLEDVLSKADSGGYAVGAFNFSNLEYLTGALEAAVELDSPIIVQTTEGAIKYAGLNLLVALARTAAAGLSIPVALHLDHGKDINIIRGAIEAGYVAARFSRKKHDTPLDVCCLKMLRRVKNEQSWDWIKGETNVTHRIHHGNISTRM